jgi:hypothetical protein
MIAVFDRTEFDAAAKSDGAANDARKKLSAGPAPKAVDAGHAAAHFAANRRCLAT